MWGSRVVLRHLLIEPEIKLTDYRWEGSTPLSVRLLWFFSYRRTVTVDRRLGVVRIETRRFWVLSSTQIINTDRVARLVCHAQAMPTGFPFWRVFATDRAMVNTDIAFYFVALRLRDSADEVPLFTVIESLPVKDGPMTGLAGESDGNRIGDEGATRLLTQLRDYLGLGQGR
jgi:hypothetical protein